MSTSKKKEINQRNAKGEKNGYWEEYYLNGKLHFKCNYKNGVLDGWFKMYGLFNRKYTKGVYKNNKKIGWCEDYYSNGKLEKSIFYVYI